MGAVALDDDPRRDARDQKLAGEPHPPRNALVAALLDLVIIVHEPDQPETERHEDARPGVAVAEVHPQQQRDRDGGQDHQPAHGGRADLLEVRLRAIVADRLALALADAQPADELRADDQPDDERGHRRRAGAEGDVADQVEQAGKPELLGDQVKHIDFPLASV
jgi:hypothetical protein